MEDSNKSGQGSEEARIQSFPGKYFIIVKGFYLPVLKKQALSLLPGTSLTIQNRYRQWKKVQVVRKLHFVNNFVFNDVGEYKY